VFLTAEELVDLTGLKRPSAQYGWLERNGWPVERDARGRPLLLRSVVVARLGGVPDTRQSGPNWAALHGTP
jgi:hypothetical protein